MNKKEEESLNLNEEAYKLSQVWTQCPLLLPLPTPPVVNTGSTPTKVLYSDLGFCLKLLFGYEEAIRGTSRASRPNLGVLLFILLTVCLLNVL